MSKRAKLARTTAAAVPAPKLPRANTNRPVLLACAGLACLLLVAFSNSFSAGLALDSRMLVLGDPRIRELTPGNLALIIQHTYWWPEGEAGLYRPLTTLSFLFNYAVLGNAETPTGYHVINFLLHFGNVLLIFALSLKLLGGRARLWTCVIIAGLWGIHPVLTESVTNVAGRADLLAATGVLSGFLMYLKASETAGVARTLWLVGVGLLTAVGVFSKESAAALPGLVLLYELSMAKVKHTGGTSRIIAIRAGFSAMLLPIALMLLQRTMVLSKSPPAEWPVVDNPIVNAGFWVGRVTALKVLARYLGIAVWPSRLSADYSYSQIPLAEGSAGDWLAWITVAACLALVLLLYRLNRPAFFFACFAVLCLLPASNLLFPIGTIMAERLLYLPVIGVVAVFVLVIEAAAARWKIPRSAFLGFIGLITVAMSVRTWVRNLEWASDRTIAAASVLTSPDSFKVHRLLAAELLDSDASETGVKRATEEADKSVSILRKLPDRLSVAEPWTLAANCHLAKAGLLSGEAAGRDYRSAVNLAMRSISIGKASRAAYGRLVDHEKETPAAVADPYRIMAAAYLHLNQPELALQAALEARTIDGKNTGTYRQIADAYLAKQKTEDAAITLAEGAFATGSEELRGDLIELYEQSDLDKNSCAVVAGPRGPALNPNCDIVHRDLCEGTARARRLDLRKQLSCPD